MAEKIKVLNTGRREFTVNLDKFNGREVKIAQGGFCLLTDDELAYVLNTSKAFELGRLKVADETKVSDDIVLPDKSPNAIDNSEVLAILKKPAKEIEKALVDISDRFLVEDMIKIAKEQNKSVKVVEMLEAKLETLIQ